jgi:hypothetical protein
VNSAVLDSISNRRVTIASLFILLLNLSYMILCIAFGNKFYRIGLGPVKISEIIVIVTLLYYLLNYPRIISSFYKNPFVISFIFLAFLYLLVSFLDNSRQPYFIVRQFSMVLYFLYIPAIGLCLRLNQEFFADYGWLLLFVFTSGLVMSLFSGGANIDGAVTVFILLIVLCKINIRFNLIWILVAALCGALVGHAGHVISLLAFFGTFYLFKNPKYVLPSIFCVLFCCIFALPYLLNSDAFTDANAAWRYIYWANIIEFLFHQSYLLLGEGYGLPYLRPEYSNYYLLVSQIGNNTEFNYQVLTTPSHNSFINILYHTGLFGVISFLLVLASLLYKSAKQLDAKAVAMLLSSSVIMLSHNGLELPYMAIPISATLGYVWVKGRFKESME